MSFVSADIAGINIIVQSKLMKVSDDFILGTHYRFRWTVLLWLYVWEDAMTPEEQRVREALRAKAKEWFKEGGLAYQTLPNERNFEDDILSLLKELGYCKVTELKMLSDEEIKQVVLSDKKRVSGWVVTIMLRHKAVAQAQRDYDQRQIEEAAK